MAFAVKVPMNVSISSHGKFGGSGITKTGFQSMRKSFVSAVMSSSTAQNVENLSIKSKDIGLPIMVLTTPLSIYLNICTLLIFFLYCIICACTLIVIVLLVMFVACILLLFKMNRPHLTFAAKGLQIYCCHWSFLLS